MHYKHLLHYLFYYLYKKELNIVSKRQFHYQHFSVIHGNELFTLDKEFKFAHDTNHYLIFVNGKKINREYWDLKLGTSNQIQLHITTSVNYVDIFYVPDICEEITISRYISYYGYGDIDIPQSDEFDFPFDKDVFFVYINGKKIPISEIENIDKNSFRIVSGGKNFENLCICNLLMKANITSLYILLLNREEH